MEQPRTELTKKDVQDIFDGKTVPEIRNKRKYGEVYYTIALIDSFGDVRLLRKQRKNDRGIFYEFTSAGASNKKLKAALFTKKNAEKIYRRVYNVKKAEDRGTVTLLMPLVIDFIDINPVEPVKKSADFRTMKETIKEFEENIETV